MRLTDGIFLCPRGATEGHLLFGSELCGSLRDVAPCWGLVFVGPSEYLSISFHLGKDADSCGFLNIHFCKAEIFEALRISVTDTKTFSYFPFIISPFLV